MNRITERIKPGMWKRLLVN